MLTRAKRMNRKVYKLPIYVPGTTLTTACTQVCRMCCGKSTLVHLPERELLLKSKVFRTRLLVKPSGRAPEKLLLPASNLSREVAIRPKLFVMLHGAGSLSAGLKQNHASGCLQAAQEQPSNIVVACHTSALKRHGRQPKARRDVMTHSGRVPREHQLIHMQCSSL